MAAHVLAVRPLDSSKGIRDHHKLDCGDSAPKRSQSPSVPGRLFVRLTKPRGSPPTRKSDSISSSRPRVDDQLQKICSLASAGSRVPGDQMGPLEQQKISANKEGQQNFRSIPKVSARKESFVERNPAAARTLEFCQLCRPQRKAEQQGALMVQSSASGRKSIHEGKSTPVSSDLYTLVDRPGLFRIEHLESGSPLFPIDRCLGLRLGCTTQRPSPVRSVDSQRKETSLQLTGNDGNIQGSGRPKQTNVEQLPDDFIRQSHSSLLSSKRGRHTFHPNDASHRPGVRIARSLSYPGVGQLHPRSIQCRSRSVIPFSTSDRVALTKPSDRFDIPNLGEARDRSVCVPESPRRSIICNARSNRSPSSFCRRFQPDMELRSSLVVSSPEPYTSGPVPSKQSQRTVSTSGSSLGESVLAQRPQEQGPGPSSPNRQFSGSPDRYAYSTSSSRPQANEFGSLADSGWAPLLDSWDDNQKKLLSSSWRRSTLASYKPAWLRWCKWTSLHKIDRNSPKPQDVAQFLSDLHIKDNLSYSSIALHKSVVSTFCPVQAGPPLSSHIVVKQMLKAIALSKPKCHKPPIWNIADLCSYLISNEPDQNSLFEVSRRCAILLLLCSGRRLHDLTLLSIKSPNCVIEDNHIIFWPIFGSKTDSATHRQSGWRLLSCSTSSNIDPVFWIKRLILLSQERRGELDSLFVSTCGPVKSATRTIIGGWVRTVLKDAGIDSSPGSVRSAVASASWLDNHNINDILLRGNWRSAKTFHHYYRKEIRPNPRNNNPLFDCFQSA